MADLTPNNREELWLQGMVDGQTTLEPNKRREYWYKEIVDAIGSGGGGGTGGVTVLTAEVSGTTATLPCTAAELYALLETGLVKIKISATIEGITFSRIDTLDNAAYYPDGVVAGIDEYQFQSSSYEINCALGSDIPSWSV